MQKIAVLSINNNKDYQFYLPLAIHYWNYWGWDVAVFYTMDCEVPFIQELCKRSESTKMYSIPNIDGVRSGTLAQVVRHFASNVLPDGSLIQVQDIDLIPLKGWNPDPSQRTIWGWELTGKSFIPVHYTTMSKEDWFSIMDCTGDLKADMERELKANGRAYSQTWGDENGVKGFWDADWDILTTKVLAQKDKFTFIERGLVNGLPKGRIDRSAIKVDPVTFEYSWNDNIPDPIDIHCESNNPASPDKWKMIKRSIENVLGPVPEWMDSYVDEFYKKYGHG